MVYFFLSNAWQMMTFLDPLNVLTPKIPFSFLADFWVRATSEAWGSVSVGFWGSRQLSPFWGKGGSSQGALSTPPHSIASPVAQDGGICTLSGSGSCWSALC